MITLITSLLLAYLIGSFSTAIILCKIYRLPDPRTYGSKNPGATNVLRSGDKKLALQVFLGDALKGAIAVWLGVLLGVKYSDLGWVALAVVVGHIYPIYFYFKGGKGVATGIGALLALAWPLGLIAAIVWIVTAKFSHYSSLAAISATVFVPFASIFLYPQFFLALTCMAILLLWKHYSNIQRILNGTESKMK